MKFPVNAGTTWFNVTDSRIWTVWKNHWHYAGKSKYKYAVGKESIENMKAEGECFMLVGKAILKRCTKKCLPIEKGKE